MKWVLVMLWAGDVGEAAIACAARAVLADFPPAALRYSAAQKGGGSALVAARLARFGLQQRCGVVGRMRREATLSAG